MGATITDHHRACGIIRAIIPGDGCPTLEDLVAAAELAGVDPFQMLTYSSAVSLPA